jgi:glyoxylase-like metal-dependent hydrolase (beta-lactamase superfamily II)
MKTIDLHFQGFKQVIATGVLEGPSGIGLIDPGPSSTLHALESGLQTLGHRIGDVKALLLTHIHLDHAGASGTLAARVPSLRVYVHQRGAAHMADPTKLMDSAGRLYGDKMEQLWGEMRPVPSDRLEVLSGGERLELLGRTLQVAYTPGHASHHVSYLDHSSGIAYVGDTTGIRRVHDYITAPTPPPDIDLEAWEPSLQTIEGWRPSALFLTHFGTVTDVTDHLRRFRNVLDTSARRVKATLEWEGSDEDRINRFIEDMREEVRLVMSEEDARSLEMAAPFSQLWQGLARYWRKRAQ